MSSSRAATGRLGFQVDPRHQGCGASGADLAEPPLDQVDLARERAPVDLGCADRLEGLGGAAAEQAERLFQRVRIETALGHLLVE